MSAHYRDFESYLRINYFANMKEINKLVSKLQWDPKRDIISYVEDKHVQGMGEYELQKKLNVTHFELAFLYLLMEHYPFIMFVDTGLGNIPVHQWLVDNIHWLKPCLERR